MKVKMPFMEKLRKPMLAGVKTCTSRTRIFGKEGDTFDAFGAEFEIVGMTELSLSEVQEFFWKQEGVKSPEEFKKVWGIHPGRASTPPSGCTCTSSGRYRHEGLSEA